MKDQFKSQYIDAHSHQLSLKQEGMLNLDFNLDLDLRSLPNRHFCIGIHPWEASTHDSRFNQVKEIAQDKYCMAIGETGLDRLHLETFEQQKISTLEHIELAKTLNKPLVFHCVRAYQDLYALLKESKYNGNLLLHDYNGTEQNTLQYLKLNSDVFFSVGKRIYNSQSKIAQSLNSIPSSKILLETDDQEEYNIEQVYEKILSLRDDLAILNISENYHEFIS